MKFLHLQLQNDANQLTLHIQTHQNTQHFQLEGPVSDPQELAHQAELFVGIHVRPYFDMLPVESCRLSVAAEVPDLVRDGCMSELIKVSKTNELLTKAKPNVDAYLASDRSTASQLLCVYSELMPLEGLLHAVDFAQRGEAQVLGYLPGQEAANETERQLRLFTSDPDAWFQWYLAQNCNALLCGQDFVSEVERQGIVLSAVLAALGHTLVVVEAPFVSGHPILQYEKRSTDSGTTVHYIQDEQSLLWGRWLGLNNIQLGTLKSLQYSFDTLDLSVALKGASFQELSIDRKRAMQTPEQPSQDYKLQVLVCEDLYLRRLLAWLPQAYFVKGLLDQHFQGSMPGAVATELWLSVMRRLIVGSNESTDYDVIVLVRRLELIAEAVQSLQLIDFIQQLEGKAEVLLCGHPDWEKILPNVFQSGYKTGDWQAACAAFPDATMLMAEPVFNPLLSKKCFESILSGQSIGCFSAVLPQCDAEKKKQILGLDWLEQHIVVSPDGCCVHAMSTTSDRETMIQKRQAILDAVAEHNDIVSEQIAQRDWTGTLSPLAQTIEDQLVQWNTAVENFYNDHAQVFHESLIVLNPQTELGITDELRADPPAYLAPVLAQMVFSEIAKTGS